MINRSSTLVTTLVIGLATAPALAAAAPPPAAQVAAEPARQSRSFSLTFSPLHLFPPADGDLQQNLLELTGELRLADRLSFAVILGGGRMKRQRTILPERSERLYAAGAQARYYVWGGFDHGLQVGAEAHYTGITGDWLKADGFVPGAFFGYKYTTRGGFTFDGQIGARRMQVADKSSLEARLRGDTKAGVEPLLNLNVGWSF